MVTKAVSVAAQRKSATVEQVWRCRGWLSLERKCCGAEWIWVIVSLERSKVLGGWTVGKAAKVPGVEGSGRGAKAAQVVGREADGQGGWPRRG